MRQHGTIKLLALVVWLAAGAAGSRAQTPSEAAPPHPEEILNRVIEAMGGDAFLQSNELTGRGRIYSFNRGELSSPGARFVYYAKFPGKERIEFGKEGNIVYVNADDQGWELDLQGIREQTPEQIQDFQEGHRRDLNNLLRFRARGEKMQVYYLGREFVDTRRVHVIELVDERGDTSKLYVDAREYLPLRLGYRERDALTREWMDVVEYYGKYITVQGIKTPLHIMRERGKRRTLEVYFSEVSYSSSVPDSLFTRASLEERWARVKKK